MNWDQLDALTMVPGLGVGILAWMSNDFLYRIAALSWIWCCICSIVYHLNNCDPKFLSYDLRAQWVSTTFMSLATPQYPQLVFLAGIIPFGTPVRRVLNCLSGFYFVSHSLRASIWIAAAFGFYVLQFPTKIKWMHSAFHMCLHAAGLHVALDPRPRYSVNVHPGWAWVVFGIGTLILIPNSIVYGSVDSLRTWASNLSCMRNYLNDLRARYLVSPWPRPSYGPWGTCGCTHEEQLDLVGSSVWTRGSRSLRKSRRPVRPSTQEPSGPGTLGTLGPPQDLVQIRHRGRNDT